AAEPADFSAYRFRWRLPRLLAWAAGAGATKAPVVAGSRRDGPDWQPKAVAAVYSYNNEPFPGRPTPAASARKNKGWQLDGQRQLAAALAEFEAALAENPEDPQARGMMAKLCAANGQPARSLEHLQWLENHWQRTSGYWSGKSLAFAYNDLGRAEDALKVATAVLDRFPKCSEMWGVRGQCEFFTGKHEAAAASLRRSLEISQNAWVYTFLLKAEVGRGQLEAAIRAIYDGYRTYNDAAATALLLGDACNNPALRERLVDVLGAYEAAPDVQVRLRALVADALAAADGQAARAVLTENLRWIATKVRNAGATPVFLDYPRPQFGQEQLRQTAAALDAPFLAVADQFMGRAGGRPWDQLRAPDGHCNDDGYQIMGTLVAEGLREVLASLR
ncbi:MAG: tetratricopeptide repeat protein, partial [Planctomycetes bacterium]|nr:tetratricopeptide repeat protein [Planctomycetota bacterium]